MIVNYLKLASRLLMRKPFFSLLNIIGLSVGFAVFLVLWQYSESELNSDKQWKDADRIARAGFFWEWTDDGTHWDNEIFGTMPSAAPANFVVDFEEFESVTRYIPQGHFDPSHTGLVNKIVVTIEDGQRDRRIFKEEGMACADPNFFEFFAIELLAGNRSNFLSDANAIVISESQSLKYFGNESALGKRILVNNVSFVVTGVFKDLPHNTHLSFNMVISNVSKLAYWAIDKPMPICYAYLKTKQPVNWSQTEEKMNHPVIRKKYWSETERSFPNGRGRFLLQPVREAAFSGWIGFFSKAPKSRPLLMAFRTIGLVVLALAIVNYISLNASRTAHRFKEIATRKVSGARGRDFFLQFSVETSLVILISVALALTWIQLGKIPLEILLQIHIPEISRSTITIFSLVTFISLMICTGYPVVMSGRFQPRALLAKSKTKRRSGGLLTLAPFQYGIATILLLSSVIIYRQITFMINKDLGFEKEMIIVIDAPLIRSDDYENRFNAFHNKIKSLSSVEQTTISTTTMGDSPNLITVRKPGVEYPVVLDTNGGVDENFISCYGLTLLAGRNFTPDEKSNVVIISEGSLTRLGFSNAENAIGSRIDVWSNDGLARPGEWRSSEIIGVLKGYRLRPFFKYGNEYDKPDRGMAFTYKSSMVLNLTAQKITARLSGMDLEGTIADMKKDFDTLFPGNFFNWYFLDAHVNRHYQNEKISRNKILFFTCLAIGIACLGLLGMMSNKAVEKTKEIGIRKVMGARLTHIATVLLNTTLKQLVLAIMISVPLSWYAGEKYLENFTEHVEQQWWHYAIPVVLFIGIMLMTVTSVVWKAARTNPVDSLRYE